MKVKVNKITWEVIFQEFKTRYPKLSKKRISLEAI